MYAQDAFYDITLFFISLNFTSKHNIQQIMYRRKNKNCGYVNNDHEDIYCCLCLSYFVIKCQTKSESFLYPFFLRYKTCFSIVKNFIFGETANRR